MFDSKSIQNRNPTIFPQDGNLFAMIGHLPGPTKEASKLNFNTRFNLVKCCNNRNLTGMFNVKHPKTKLCRPGTKVPFFSKELSSDMLAELIDLFTPQGGNILDPYSGSMSSIIAALRIGRNAIGLEKKGMF